MQYAKSILYGGLLVPATDCNHKDFQRLLLVCPYCNESVFLVAAHERLLRSGVPTALSTERYYNEIDKKISVALHFSHRADKDPHHVNTCELRVAHELLSELKKSEVASRNQRLKLFNRHLWNLLKLCYKLKDFENAQSNLSKGFKLINAEFYIFCKEVTRIHAESEQYLDRLIEKTRDKNLVNNSHLEVAASRESHSREHRGDLEVILATWRQTIDRTMHLQIYNEVVDCLVQKKHLPVLQNLVVLGLYNFTLVQAMPSAVCSTTMSSARRLATATLSQTHSDHRP